MKQFIKKLLCKIKGHKVENLFTTKKYIHKTVAVHTKKCERCLTILSERELTGRETKVKLKALKQYRVMHSQNSNQQTTK